MEQWTRGHITIMGDAAHPMMPFMAQGAAMAIEDAVVLGRSLENVTNNHVAAALGRYELARKARTAEVQRNSLRGPLNCANHCANNTANNTCWQRRKLCACLTGYW